MRRGAVRCDAVRCSAAVRCSRCGTVWRGAVQCVCGRSVRRSVRPSVARSVRPSVGRSVGPSVRPSVRVSTTPSLMFAMATMVVATTLRGSDSPAALQGPAAPAHSGSSRRPMECLMKWSIECSIEWSTECSRAHMPAKVSASPKNSNDPTARARIHYSLDISRSNESSIRTEVRWNV